MALRDTIKGLLGKAWHVQGDNVVDGMLPAVDGTAEAGKVVVTDANNKVGSADLTKLVGGVAAAYKIARGTVTLDGSNPTTAATGLTTIVAAVVGLKSATAPADDPSWLSCNYTGSDGNLDIYAWKNTGGTDPTLVASTNAAATVDWIAVGT